MPRAVSARASSSTPVLSETESSARRTGSVIELIPRKARSPGAPGKCSGAAEAELLQLLAQRAAVDAENAGGAALVTFGVVEYHAEQRLFDLAQNEIVQMCRPVAVQAGEILAEGTLGVGGQGQLTP